MIIPILVIIPVWLIALLNITHVINNMYPVNSALFALAATIFAVRYSIRNKDKAKKKGVSLATLNEPEN